MFNGFLGIECSISLEMFYLLCWFLLHGGKTSRDLRTVFLMGQAGCAADPNLDVFEDGAMDSALGGALFIYKLTCQI